MFNTPPWPGDTRGLAGCGSRDRSEGMGGRARGNGCRGWRRDVASGTPKGRNAGPRERGGNERGREDIAESYGPSTSRSNILANLCPIKINQTPSRSAVSGPA